ncbi:hypothetical protein NSZ01_05090 [Nocardioides szechwanensis]|nr:hypothetical protein NSZ01_05090 [Nocardioides szechwanensis]
MALCERHGESEDTYPAELSIDRFEGVVHGVHLNAFLVLGAQSESEEMSERVGEIDERRTHAATAVRHWALVLGDLERQPLTSVFGMHATTVAHTRQGESIREKPSW